MAGADFLGAVDFLAEELGTDVKVLEPGVVEPTPTQIVTELRFIEDP